MDFRYFDAAESEFGWYSEDLIAPTPVECGCCGKIAHCLEGHDSATDASALGCLGCLNARKFQIYHETELGRMMDGYQFRKRTGNPFAGELVETYSDLPDGFQPSSFDELLQTPYFHYFQNEEWLVHCNDFMVCLGRWKPEDFRNHAEDGDSDALLKSMTDFDSQVDLQLSDLSNPTYCYVAFRCRHCRKLRG